MKKRSPFIAVVLSVVLILGSFSAVFAETAGNDAGQQQDVSKAAEEMVKDADYVEDQVIVVFKDSVSNSKISKVCKDQDGQCTSVKKTADENKMAIAEIDTKDSVAEAITKFEQDPRVEYAQPNYTYQTQEEPSDPLNTREAGGQWYFENIKAEEAANVMKGTTHEKTRVAVIDTGIDMNHEDLQENINKELSVRVDNKGGFEPLKTDLNGHGTHVAGVIAATADNGKGIAGIASLCGNDAVELMAIDIAYYEDDLMESMVMDTFNVVQGIDYAVDNDAKVINMSLGSFGRDRVIEASVENAYANGVVTVCAGGNGSVGTEVSPSDFGEAISVCSVDRENKRDRTDSGSCYGLAKDISAPGVSIISTVPGDQYEHYSGTSMASPMVAAGAAMVLSVNPNLTPAQVKNILCATADGNIGTKAGFDKYTGYGLLDLEAAVTAAKDASVTVPATSIEMKDDYFKMLQEDTYMVETLVKPATSLQNVTFQSSDESIAEVDANGKVKAKKRGDVEITASVNGQTATCEIEVTGERKVESVQIFDIAGNDIEKITVSTSSYEPFLLAAEVFPENAVDSNIYWTSSDKKIATVDEFGRIKGNGAGTCTITAYSYNNKQDTVEVTVKETSDIVNITTPTNRIKAGDTVIFTAEAVTNEGNTDVFDKEIFWYSSNRAIAEIDEETGELTAKKAGRVTIYADTRYYTSAKMKIVVYRTDYSAGTYGLKAVSHTYNSNKLTWKSIPNADGYEIWRNAGNGYKNIKNVSGSAVSYIDKDLKTGKSYKYKIKAYYNLGGSPAVYDKCEDSKVVSAAPVPGKTKLKAKAGANKASLSWTKVSGASGYTIYKYSSSAKKYKAIKNVGSSTLKYTNKGLKKGKTYSYKVKAYKTVSGKKVYGAYSNTIKVKAK